MIYDETTHHYVLTSGRRFYANGGILGLGLDGDELSEGYDGTVGIDGWYDYDGMKPQDFTPEERQEIADMMIQRWTAWAARKG